MKGGIKIVELELRQIDVDGTGFIAVGFEFAP